jgi:hypothetical protein
MQQVRKKYNIVRPENDARCLRCHTTAKGLVPQVSTEGVGCEACHGPASGYIELSGHAIGSEPYALARKNGMWAILYTEGIALREKMCNRCHNKERLCKIEGVKVKEISLQAIAEYPFKHPLAK